MRYIYVKMRIDYNEDCGQEINAVVDEGIPEVYATPDDFNGELNEGEFLMPVPVYGKDYPFGY